MELIRTKHKISKEGVYGTLFAGIPLAGLLFFSLTPIAVSAVTVFFEMRGCDFGTMTWNNFANFERVFTDKLFWHSVGISLYATSAQVISLAIAVFVAVLLNQKLTGSRFYKIMFFVPYICSTVATSVMWKWVFNTNYGILNNTLVSIFGENGRINWFGDKNWFMPMLILVMVWNMPGYGIVLIGAALNAVNRNLYEAAQIDGAGRARQFISITFPSISPTVFFLLMVGLIHGMQTFDVINIFAPSGWVMGGGPEYSGLTTVFYIYDTATRNTNMPVASLMSWLLFLIISIVSIINFKISDRWVSYD